MSEFQNTRVLAADFDDNITTNSMALYMDLYLPRLQELGVEMDAVELREVVQPVWGKNSEEVIRFVVAQHNTLHGLPDPEDEKIRAAVQKYEQALRDGTFVERAEVVPKAFDALEGVRSRGVLLGLATGNAVEVVNGILDKYGVEKNFFIETVSAYDLPRELQKPHPHSIAQIKRKVRAILNSRVLSSEVVYSGDSFNDFKMATYAHVEPVMTLTGNLDRRQAAALGVPELNILDNICQIGDVIERREDFS